MSPSEQERKWVDVRMLWPHEALHFTPWLAQNLDLLGNELDMKLELIGRELPVGPFFLDILARDTATGELVAIENQLEWTDFNHLGQLLTYATGCDARAAIWVAPEFRYELAEALHRLNDWTTAGISFYGVKVQAAVATDGSDPEPSFCKVVYPGGWDTGETLAPGQSESPDARRSREFFEPLIAEVARIGILPAAPVQLYGHTGRYFPSPHNQGIWYGATLEGTNDAWVTCHIQTPDDALTKRIFDTLQDDRSHIEGAIDIDPAPEWHWRRHDRWTFSSASIRKDGSINDPPEEQHQTRTWMLDHLDKFKKVLDPRIANILDR